MKKKNVHPISEERLFRHFLPEQMKENELNPDEFPEESEQCTKKTDSCGQSYTVDLAGCGVPAASFITIPRLVLPTELYSQGNLSRILPILHGIGHYTDLEPLLKNDYSPLSVLKKALQQWFAGMVAERN